jgi:hypothetical protein
MYNYDDEAYKSYRKYQAQVLRAKRFEDKIIKKQLEQFANEQKQAQKELDKINKQ